MITRSEKFSRAVALVVAALWFVLCLAAAVRAVNQGAGEQAHSIAPASIGAWTFVGVYGVSTVFAWVVTLVVRPFLVAFLSACVSLVGMVGVLFNPFLNGENTSGALTVFGAFGSGIVLFVVTGGLLVAVSFGKFDLKSNWRP